MEIYNKIRDIRKIRGLSQSDLAKKLGISQRAYSKLELNETKLNWTKLNQISDVLNIGVWELVETNNKYDPKENRIEKNVNLLQQLIDKYENKIRDLESEIIELKKSQI